MLYSNVLLLTGSSSPPSSRFLEVVFIPIGGLVTIGMLVLSGQVAAILLVVFNVLWRRHKYIILCDMQNFFACMLILTDVQCKVIISLSIKGLSKLQVLI